MTSDLDSLGIVCRLLPAKLANVEFFHELGECHIENEYDR